MGMSVASDVLALQPFKEKENFIIGSITAPVYTVKILQHIHIGD